MSPRRSLPKPIVKPDYDPRALAAQCGSCNFCAKGTTPVKGRIQGKSDFLVVLDRPDSISEKHGEVRTTRPLKLLTDSLASSGARDVDMVYAIACKPPEGATNAEIQQARESCYPRFENEVNSTRKPGDGGELQRKWLLALGQEAFESATGKLGGLDSWAGSPIEGAIAGTKVIPTWGAWHIATAKGSRLAGVFLTHIERAVRLQQGTLKEWEWPETVLDNTAQALARVLEVARAGGEWGFDIEATSLEFDKATVTCLGFAIADLAVSVQLPCSAEEEVLARAILKSGVMVGQNLKYDRGMMRAKGYEITPEYEDLLLAHSILEPQHAHNLGFQAASETWAPAWKASFRADEFGNTIWDRGTDEQEREKRLYNSRDTWMSLYLWQAYKAKLDLYK